MTIIYEEAREVKEVVTKKEIATVCDWCGGKIVGQGYGEPYNVKVTIKVSLIDDPGWDGVSTSAWRVDDLCITCSCKLRKLLQDSGIKIVADDNYHDDICEERGIDISLPEIVEPS